MLWKMVLLEQDAQNEETPSLEDTYTENRLLQQCFLLQFWMSFICKVHKEAHQMSRIAVRLAEVGPFWPQPPSKTHTPRKQNKKEERVRRRKNTETRTRMQKSQEEETTRRRERRTRGRGISENVSHLTPISSKDAPKRGVFTHDLRVPFFASKENLYSWSTEILPVLQGERARRSWVKICFGHVDHQEGQVDMRKAHQKQ